MDIPPELFPAIIYAAWNSRLTTASRRQLASTLILVNKYWKTTFLRISRENLHFCSNEQALRYIRFLESRSYEDMLNHCKRTTSIHAVYDASRPMSLAYAVVPVDKPTSSDLINWSFFNRKKFPNLKVVSIELNRHKTVFLGLEDDWTWLYGLPPQVDTLEFQPVIACNWAAFYAHPDNGPDLDIPEVIKVKSKHIKHVRFYDMENDESLAWALLAPLFPNLQTVKIGSNFAEKPLNLENQIGKKEYHKWQCERSKAEKKMWKMNDLFDDAYTLGKKKDVAHFLCNSTKKEKIKKNIANDKVDSALTDVVTKGGSFENIDITYNIREKFMAFQVWFISSDVQ